MSVFFICLSAIGLPPLAPCNNSHARYGTHGQHARYGMCDGDNKTVTLRGANYIRLGGVPPYHSTFSAADYDRSRFLSSMSQLNADGYNVVRVFVDHRPTWGIAGAPGSQAPLDESYVGRLAQFVADAERSGLYTIITLENLPANVYFANLTRGLPPGRNAQFLTQAGASAWIAYCEALAKALGTTLEPRAVDAVLVSLSNEFFLLGDAWPFDATSGSAATAAGTFDMGVAADRQQAADANTGAWADGCRSALRAHLASTLVTVGVFTFAAVHKAGPDGLRPADCEQADDCRFPARPYWLSRSTLDFLDVHIYQADGDEATLGANLETEEWDEVNPSKPVLMGEFGCLGGVAGGGWYADAAACAPHVAELQRTSCAFGFVGWLFWTYDTDDVDEQPEWFSMVDEEGAIGAALAPKARPDPCT